MGAGAERARVGPGNCDRWLRRALALAAAAAVFWFRVLPLELREVDRRAEAAARRELAASFAHELSPRLPPAERQRELARRAAEWIAGHRQEFQQRVAALAEEWKASLRYPGGDGREHVYLGDLDSYAWLRAARNLLEKGTVCDEIVDGACRDAYTHAPAGARMKYGRSLHTLAIAAVHRVATRLVPDYPLPASAYWVPVFVGVAGVWPAFALGCQAGGTAGGLVAALLVSLHPALLARSIGSDNDVWNVVLPLFELWAVAGALRARTTALALGWALLAAGFAGLHAATWRGWVLPYAVILAGLALYWLRSRASGSGSACASNRRGVAALAYALASPVVAQIGGVSGSTLAAWPKLVIKAAVGLARTEIWPSVFPTVAELEPQGWARAARAAGGEVLLAGGAAGICALLGGRGRRGLALATVSMASVFAAHWLDPAPLVALALVCAPMAAAALLRTGGRGPEGSAAVAPILAAWFAAGLYLAMRSARFALLIAPPAGVGFAAAVAAVLRGAFSPLPLGRAQWPARAAVLAALCASLYAPLQRAYAAASGYLPAMNDAWWDTLQRVRRETPAETVASTWWDYGYWGKFVAERRVLFDGGSLTGSVAPWLGRALLTADEAESLGILRMLHCRRARAPGALRPEAAFDRILALTGDALAAYAFTADIVQLDRAAAERYLAQRGFEESDREAILALSHCEPPPALLILSGEQVETADAWIALGSWDFRDQWIRERARSERREEIAAELAKRLKYSQAEAEERCARALDRRPMQAVLAASDPVAPRSRRITEWLPCRRTAGGMFSCRLGIQLERAQVLLVSFSFDPHLPAAGVVHYRRNGEERLRSAVPAAVIVAGAALQEFAATSSPLPGVGVLIDLERQQVAIGLPELLRSQFTQLLYLDGRYARRFSKFDDRSAGFRVVAWHVQWDQ